MVKMSMCAKIVDGCQSVILYVVDDRVLFTLREGTTIDDDAFFGIVADDVTVFLKDLLQMSGF